MDPAALGSAAADPASLENAASVADSGDAAAAAHSACTSSTSSNLQNTQVKATDPSSISTKSSLTPTKPQKYIGVRQRPSGRWVAEIKDSTQKLRLWLGTYNTAVEAAQAYDDAARALRGACTRTNFPQPAASTSLSSRPDPSASSSSSSLPAASSPFTGHNPSTSTHNPASPSSVSNEFQPFAAKPYDSAPETTSSIKQGRAAVPFLSHMLVPGKNNMSTTVAREPYEPSINDKGILAAIKEKFEKTLMHAVQSASSDQTHSSIKCHCKQANYDNNGSPYSDNGVISRSMRCIHSSPPSFPFHALSQSVSSLKSHIPRTTSLQSEFNLHKEANSSSLAHAAKLQKAANHGCENPNSFSKYSTEKSHDNLYGRPPLKKCKLKSNSDITSIYVPPSFNASLYSHNASVSGKGPRADHVAPASILLHHDHMIRDLRDDLSTPSEDENSNSIYLQALLSDHESIASLTCSEQMMYDEPFSCSSGFFGSTSAPTFWNRDTSLLGSSFDTNLALRFDHDIDEWCTFWD